MRVRWKVRAHYVAKKKSRMLYRLIIQKNTHKKRERIYGLMLNTLPVLDVKKKAATSVEFSAVVKRETKSFALIKNKILRDAFSTRIEVCWWPYTSKIVHTDENCVTSLKEYMQATAHRAQILVLFLVLFCFLSITLRPIFSSSLSLSHIGLCVLIFSSTHSIPFLFKSVVCWLYRFFFSMSGFYFL
jgi:hypothetical protein